MTLRTLSTAGMILLLGGLPAPGIDGEGGVRANPVGGKRGAEVGAEQADLVNLVPNSPWRRSRKGLPRGPEIMCWKQEYKNGLRMSISYRCQKDGRVVSHKVIGRPWKRMPLWKDAGRACTCRYLLPFRG